MRKLGDLPIERVRPQLAALRAIGRTFAPDVCRKLVEDTVGDEARQGAVSLDAVHAIAFQRYAVVRLVPVGSIIDDVLGRQ